MKNILIALFVALSCGFAHADSSPQRTLAQFYAKELVRPSSGLPTEAEREELRAVFSPALIKLLGEAAAAETICINKAPAGDKPDLIEGNLYTGIYEGASEVVYTDLTIEGSQANAGVELVYADPQFPKGHPHRTAASTIRVLLHQEKEQWQIDNVIFSGRSETQLTKILQKYINDCTHTEDNSKP